MSRLHYDFPLRENPNRPVREPGNAVIVDETTAICPVCHDVDCNLHADDADALEAERVARDTAAVISSARACLDAWDASDAVPPRIRMALSDLSDALAKLERIPF